MEEFVRVFEVHVGVSLRRPPRTDQIRKYLIVTDLAGRASEAELLACQWAGASTGVVMPVFSRVA
jgi:hypothetical protein